MRIARTIDRSRQEGGAVAAMVVISLVALLGLVGLSVDGGGLVLQRRALVNANDAAAIAFGESCVKNFNGSQIQDPDVAANTAATSNVAGSLRTDVASGGTGPAHWPYTGTCNSQSPGPGQVTVSYCHGQNMYFAPIVGFPKDYKSSSPCFKPASNVAPVRAAATATWGPLISAYVNPLELDTTQLINCVNPFPPTNPQQDIGKQCGFWFEQNIGASQVGFMNLNKWGVPGGASCPNVGDADRSNWILNGFTGQLAIKSPPPTYVCIDSGVDQHAWANLSTKIGTLYLFPVNDANGTMSSTNYHPQVDMNGFGCTDPQALAKQCIPAKYSIGGFAMLKLIKVENGTTAVGNGDAGTGVTASGACSTTDKFGWTTKVGTLNTDYSYNASTHVVTWLRTKAQDISVTQRCPANTTSPNQCNAVKIAWTWSTTAVAGICGYHVGASSLANDECVIVEYDGFAEDVGTACTLQPSLCPTSNVYTVSLTKTKV